MDPLNNAYSQIPEFADEYSTFYKCVIYKSAEYTPIDESAEYTLIYEFTDVENQLDITYSLINEGEHPTFYKCVIDEFAVYPPIYEFTNVKDERKNDPGFVRSWYANHGYAIHCVPYTTDEMFHVAYKHMYKGKPVEHCKTCATMPINLA